MKNNLRLFFRFLKLRRDGELLAARRRVRELEAELADLRANHARLVRDRLAAAGIDYIPERAAA